jgi:Na+/proline symporter
LPYIALQLKSISDTFNIVTNTQVIMSLVTPLLTFVLRSPCLLPYGTKYVDASEKRHGIVTAVAIESILKLVFF